MGDNSKIDKLFSDGLNDFEASPQSDSWARINATMEKKQQKKRGFYWRWASIAAAVVLAFYSGYYFNDNTTIETYPNIQNTEPNNSNPDYISHEESMEQSELNEQVSKETSQPERGTQKPKGSTSDRIQNLNKVASNSSSSEKPALKTNGKAGSASRNTSKQNVVIADKTWEQEAENIVVSNFEENSNTDIESEEIATGETQNQTVKTMEEHPVVLATPKETQLNPSSEILDYAENPQVDNSPFSRFSISAMASPTFPFTDITVNQSDETTEDNVDQQKLKTSYSYGLGFGYRLSKKLELQTGIMVNHWNQEATGVKLKVTPSFTTSTNTSLDASGNTSSGNVNFTGLTDPTNQGKLEATNIGGQPYSILPGLKESYQFIEVPIAIGYYLLDNKRWFVKANIGLNSRFISQSKVTLVYADGTEVPYEQFDLETYSMQLIGGFGAGVKFAKNWEFGLHPTLLYGITQVNTHSEIDTYFHQVLIYSSLSYRF
ncbi:outer membrane beta-barrel protein [Owenweeksia hongkongensis]|uniref:outer membrane beta-barrel protein n=1 Tax=Owenweeksia hongkongensis TaxID=253245 RepID=UPI003A8EE3E3